MARTWIEDVTVETRQVGTYRVINSLEGMARAKAEGRTDGRPKLVTDAIASDIRARRTAGESFRSIAKSVGYGVATVQNVLKSAPAMD